MPVYLRKNVVFTPPSIDRVSLEDEDDYLQDPEQLRDVLPQPYRRIDKILNDLLDNVWEIISEKEAIKLKEQQKIRPPKYEASVQFPSHGQATAMTDSVDGRYIFVGMPGGLSVIDCQSREVVGSWEEEKLEITHMKAHLIGPQMYMVVTLDDLGIGRLFGYAGDLYLLKALNELEHNNTVMVSKAEASLEADYMGVVMENTGTRETWLDVLRLPRDQWLRELEAAQTAAAKRAEQAAATGVDGQDDSLLEVNHSFDLSASVEPENPPSVHSPQGSSQQPQPTGSARQSPPPSFSLSPNDRLTVKFTAPSLVLHLKSPNTSITSQNHSLSTAIQKIDTGDVIGLGQNHIVSSSHWEHRDAIFNHLHENLLKFLPNDESPETPIVSASFHFLMPGRLMLTAPDGTSVSTVPVGIAVWWTGGTQLMHYSFSRAPSTPKEAPKPSGKERQKSGRKSPKTAKPNLEEREESPKPGKDRQKSGRRSGKSPQPDLEEPQDVDVKPDIVWPFTQVITASASSPCSSLLAVGLESGTICVYDRYLGLEKGVMNISSEAIEHIQFLNPSAVHQENSLPYRIQSPGALILAACRDGAQYFINANHMRYTMADCIREVPETLDEKETILGTMPDAPELLLLVQRQGRILLRDWTTRADVCELSLPETHKLKLPWEPVISFGSGGHLVFLRGTLKEMPKPDTPPPAEVEPTPVEEAPPVETPDTNATSGTKTSRRHTRSQLSKKTSKTKTSSASEEKEPVVEPEVVPPPALPEDATPVEPPSHLFIFTLRSFPPLDPYWRKKRQEVPLLVHTTVEQRAEALLRERISEQTFRKNRMQTRWHLLRNDLELMMKSKERESAHTRPKIYSEKMTIT